MFRFRVRMSDWGVLERSLRQNLIIHEADPQDNLVQINFPEGYSDFIDAKEEAKKLGIPVLEPSHEARASTIYTRRVGTPAEFGLTYEEYHLILSELALGTRWFTEDVDGDEELAISHLDEMRAEDVIQLLVSEGINFGQIRQALGEKV